MQGFFIKKKKREIRRFTFYLRTNSLFYT